MSHIEMNSKRILSELMDAYERSDRRDYNVTKILIIIFMLMSITGLGFCAYYLHNGRQIKYVIGIILLSIFIGILAILFNVTRNMQKSDLKQLRMIFDIKTKPLIWLLDGDQWIK